MKEQLVDENVGTPKTRTGFKIEEHKGQRVFQFFFSTFVFLLWLIGKGSQKLTTLNELLRLQPRP